jgi:formylglycine-generating enzyme required for sulfatase activity
MRFSILLLSILILFIGCEDDCPVAPVTTVTINIEILPEGIETSWELTGPNNYINNGSGDIEIAGLEPGGYEISYEFVNEYITPEREQITLSAGEEILFIGIYNPSIVGMVEIPAGSFVMGSPEDEPGRYSNETEHTVTLTNGFYMSATEVTNQQYADLAQWALDNDYCVLSSSSLIDNLDGSVQELIDLSAYYCEISFSDSIFSVDAGKENHPVMEVTWYGSVAYCDWLSLQEGLPRAYSHSKWQCNNNAPYQANGYRLPTEAEWEYACRAGTTTAFNTGDCLDAGTEANYNGVSPQSGCPSGPYEEWSVLVGSYPANSLGLYDMHGSLHEWCNNWYNISYGGDVTDPVGEIMGLDRIIRGGSWHSHARYCRSAYRGGYDPNDGYGNVGFRYVKSAQ